MIEIMKFYVSGFWVFAGLSFGLCIVVGGVAAVANAIAACILAFGGKK